MKRIRLILLLSVLLVVPAFALIGIGAIVFDPTSYANALQMFYEMQAQYNQLVRTYGQIKAEYEQMLLMARRVPVDMNARYRAAMSPWRILRASDTYGTTAAWVQSLNSGQSVSSAYQQASEALQAYGSALDGLPPSQLSRIKRMYGTVELADGASQHTMETLGTIRRNAPRVEQAVQLLEDDSLSADPAMNTEIAVLNKINAASIIAVRSAQDANKILVTLSEAQLIEAKRTREAETHAINAHIRFRREGRQLLDSQAANASQAMKSWQMP